MFISVVKKNLHMDPDCIKKRIVSFSSGLAHMCERYLDYSKYKGIEIEDDPNGDLFYNDFFNNYSFKDDSYERFISSCAICAVAMPEEKSWETFIKCFPTIDLKSEEKPTCEESNLTFASYISDNTVWKNKTKKSLVYYFIQTIYTDFLTEIFQKMSGPLKSESFVRTISAYILSFFRSPYTPPYYCIKNNLAQLKAVNIYYLSQLAPDIVWDQFSSLFQRSITDDQRLLVFKMMSSFTLTDTLPDKAIHFVTQMVEQFKDSTGEMHTACGKFLMNIVLQILVKNPGIANQRIFHNMYSDLKTIQRNTYSLISSELFAALTNHIHCDQNLISADSFFKIFVPTLTGKLSFPEICSVLTCKLWGQNYEPFVKIEKEAPNLIWSCDFENRKEFYLNISAWLISNFDSVHEHPSAFELNAISGFLEQLCAIDPQSFIAYIIPVINDRNYIPRFGPPLARGMRILLQNRKNQMDENNINDLKPLLLNTAIQLFKIQIKHPEECNTIFRTNSITESLSASIEGKEKTLDKMFRTLSQTSYPIFDDKNNPAPEVNKTLQMFDLKKIFGVEESIEKDSLSKLNKINTEEELLLLTLYLEPNHQLAKCLCNFLFSESPFTVTLAMRCMQGLIHQNTKFAELFVQQLCYLFKDTKTLSLKAIITIISTLILILVTSDYENVIFSKETIIDINCVVLIGLCVPMGSFRSRIFEMFRILKKSKTTNLCLIYFIDKYENDISRRALSNAATASSMRSIADINALPPAKFADLANTNYSLLFAYYIASLGYYLACEGSSFDEDLPHSLLSAFNILMKLLIEPPKESMIELFRKNCTTLLISLFPVTKSLDYENSYFNLERIRSICLQFLTEYNESKHNDISLIAMFSTSPPELLPTIFSLLCKPVLYMQQTLASVIKNMLVNKLIEPLDEDGHVKPDMYSALHSGLVLLHKIGFMESKEKAGSSSSVQNNPMLIMFLNNFSIVLKIVFDHIFEFFSKKEEIPFLQKLTFSQKATNHAFDTEKWLTFFCNVTTINEPTLNESSQNAFASWIRISKITDDPQSDEIKQMIQFYATKSLSLSIAFFAHNPDSWIDIYIENARTNFHMFGGLSGQIDIPQNLIDHIDTFVEQSNESDIKKSSLLSIYYSQCGRLIALCFQYLSSQNGSEREEALDFLEKIVCIAMMARKAPIIPQHSSAVLAAQLLKKIKDMRILMNTSFSVFIQTEIFNLSREVADRFVFCSEQFVDECFLIVMALSNESKIELKKALSRDTIYVSQQQLTKLSDVKRASTNGVFFLSKEDSDTIDVKQTEIIMNLIPKWLESFSYDLHTVGICTLCETQFKCFSIYKFLEKLLQLCSILDMIQSIADILDLIIRFEGEPNFFTFALFNLQLISDSYRDSALTFLIYLFNKKPDTFIEIISHYISISSWYYYQIQCKQNDDKRFNDITCFALKVFQECYKENPQPFAQFNTRILHFCSFLYIDALDNKDNKEKRNVIEEEEKILKEFKVLKSQKEKPSFEETPFGKQINRNFLLEWGLCCGQLSAAAEALKCFNDNQYILQPQQIDLILRSMQCVASLLSEITKSQPTSELEINHKKCAVEYLNVCLKTLYNYTLQDENDFSIKVLQTAIAFLRCKSEDYSDLFSISISIIEHYISSPKFLSKIFNEHETVVGDGLLDLIFNCSYADTKLLENIGSIVRILIEKRYTKLLSNKDNADVISLYVLVPFMWGKLNKIPVCQSIAEYYASKIKDKSDVRQIVNNAISGQSRSPQNLEKLNELFSSYLIDSLKPLLHFYLQIVKNAFREQNPKTDNQDQTARNSTQDQIDAVLSLLVGNLTTILQSDDLKEDIAEIARLVSTMTSSGETSEFVLKFLREIQSKERFNKGSSDVSKKTVDNAFPELLLYDTDKMLQWQPSSDDVFDEPLHFPPLYVTYSTFDDTEFNNKLKTTVESVREFTFTKLGDQFNKAKSQVIADTKAKLQIDFHPFAFFWEIQDIISSANNDQNDMHDNEIDEFGNFYDTPMVSIKPFFFFPRESEIAQIGKEKLLRYDVKLFA